MQRLQKNEFKFYICSRLKAKYETKLKIWHIIDICPIASPIVTKRRGDCNARCFKPYNKCFVSQARPMRNAIEKFYLFCSPLSCEMGHGPL